MQLMRQSSEEGNTKGLGIFDVAGRYRQKSSGIGGWTWGGREEESREMKGGVACAKEAVKASPLF